MITLRLTLVRPYVPVRNLRSTSKYSLEVPSYNLESYGHRAFGTLERFTRLCQRLYTAISRFQETAEDVSFYGCLFMISINFTIFILWSNLFFI